MSQKPVRTFPVYTQPHSNPGKWYCHFLFADKETEASWGKKHARTRKAF